MRSPDDKSALTLPAPESLRRVRIVLVEPRTAVNIGATARAMSTMGLGDLALVRPVASHTSAEARAVAHNAAGLLDASAVFETVPEACAEAALVVGTSNRRRSRIAPEPLPVREATLGVVQVSRERRVAVLFGNEETGLGARDLSYCHWLAAIPTVPEYRALNLSHAVMVVAYELFLASAAEVATPVPDFATVAELERLIERINALMIALGFRPHEDDPETFLLSLRRAFHHMGLERRDVRTLHIVLRSLERVQKRGA